jgi:FkbM family methyltransferase
MVAAPTTGALSAAKLLLCDAEKIAKLLEIYEDNLMRDPFALPLADETVSEVLLKRLKSEQDFLKVADVGARNGLEWPASLSRATHLFGFEPNKVEYDKLIRHQTDAQRLNITQTIFGKEDYFNCAVWSATEERPFYITQGPGACTLMGEDEPSVTGNMWMDWVGQSYHEAHTKVVSTTNMTCRRLDELFSDGVDIDFLKIDVEGAELDVLEGAKGLLGDKRVSIIKTEFVLFPYYQRHPVLGDQHSFLNDFGYRMLTMELDKSAYTLGQTSIPAEADRRLHYAGDAYFLLDPVRHPLAPERAYRAGLVLIALGFRSLGVQLIRRSGLFDEAILGEVERALHRLSRNRRLRYLWNSFPDRVLQLVRR